MQTPRPIIYAGCVLIGIFLGSLKQMAFPHYRVYVHDLGTGGAHMPVFLKFDSREGRAWKSRGLDQAWQEMTEDNLRSEMQPSLPAKPAGKPL